MSEFNKTYRIRTNIGEDTQLHVKLDRKYDILELMSLKINQENAYKFHTSNYGVIAGRVLANDAFGVPNAKISVFINIDDDDINNVVKSVLYPYNTTHSKDKNGVRYNLLPNEQLSNCHTIIGTFPEKQYMLDNDSVLEVFEKYYKYTTRTNNAGDYMIFGVPTGSQTIHVDIDLSDIGILSQKPRDMVYKGYNIDQFENPNKFKFDTNLETLSQVISQDNIVDVIPFWGDENEGMIGITRCDINVQYKFEPTCVFMGSVVSDTSSNGISKKCIPSPGMGAMDELTTGSGTIEMIRKTPSGGVEEFQIQGTQLINGDGVWCYQIPMNLDYMMTDEFGNMVPTNNPEKGVPTRTKVRFRMSMQDFENDNSNIFRCKILVPHNPDIFSNECDDQLDYQFGTNTKEDSYRDLFWNCVYTVKSYIPRIQKGTNWKNEKFTGFKRVNYHGDKNPIPYNNIRIQLPFAYTMLCSLIKLSIRLSSFLNWVFKFTSNSFISQDNDGNFKASASFLSFSGELCNDNLEHLCIIPGIDVRRVAQQNGRNATLLGIAILKHYEEVGGVIDLEQIKEGTKKSLDTQSIDYNNSNYGSILPEGAYSVDAVENGKKGKKNKVYLSLRGLRVTDSLDYFIQCIEMKLAQEFRVIQFDFYNDWINGLIYIPRWERNITKKRNYLWGAVKFGGKVKACNENYKSGKRNLVQQCGLSYNLSDNDVKNNLGCHNKRLQCHKDISVRKYFNIFKQNGIVHTTETMKSQYVYYFKPYENSNNKNVRLFSTDIVLLGTLNECDKFGITNDLTELVSTTYQMPPNLAMTDSDLEGNDYEAKTDMTRSIKITYKPKNGTCSDIEGLDYNENTTCYVGINPMEEDANYTEMSGINWDYTGPLQDYIFLGFSGDDNVKFYKPGGHFLGITCRNSETTVKTCVNLSRICEHGVWMSQRQVLNTPSSTVPKNITEAFSDAIAKGGFATVPSGFISKDEISDTNYRRSFASMNKNRLKTIINNENGYPVYDFEYVNPTNFGGELTTRVNNSSKIMNRWVTNLEKEHYFEYTDENYYKRSDIVDELSIPLESQIMRTGEFLDTEYYKFRFGLTDSQLNNNNEKRKRFLLEGSITNETSTYSVVSFPMYDNSFYFYFGLHDGKTAIDEFKKSYYAVCEKNNNLIQKDDSIKLHNLNIGYNGMCSETPSGSIEFSIRTSPEIFESGVTCKLINDIDEATEEITITGEKDIIKYNSLKHGNYVINISSGFGDVETFNIEVKQIKLTSELGFENFIKDVSTNTPDTTFLEDRLEYRGYITINGNSFDYDDGVIKQDEEGKTVYNIFESGYVKQIRITNSKDNSVITNSTNSPLNFTYKNNIHTITVDANGNYMIPVQYPDTWYYVYIDTYIDDNCKLTNIATTSTYSWNIGSVYISNAIPLEILYNGIPYESAIQQYEDGNETFDSVTGWWSPSGNNGWLLENETIQWRLKEALYLTSDNPHSVSITTIGGVTPYETNIYQGSVSTDKDKEKNKKSISDLSIIRIPTINYVNKDNQRALNYLYNAKDSNNQKAPKGKEFFVFPVIYKPFFMEMAILYFDNVNKYYLYGNVYNGKTWDYKNEGFNDTKLNGLNIANLTTINNNDSVMKIDEPSLTSESGGYSYSGIYSKYNGRKVVVSREIEPISYGLDNYGLINNLDLSIGCKHTDDGFVYSDYTSCVVRNLELCQFTFIGKEYKGNYYVKMEEVRPIYSNKQDNNNFNLIPVINSATKGYLYPWGTNSPNLSDKLFRDIISNNVSSSDVTTKTIDGVSGFIDVSGYKDSTEKLYYIAKQNTTNIHSKSNKETVFCSVSFSNLINLGSLAKFYPLDVRATATDILTKDGKYETKIEIKPAIIEDNESLSKKIKDNFNGKKFEITFYDPKNDTDKIPTHTFIAFSSNNIIKLDVTQYRLILGLTHNEETTSGDGTTLRFDFDVYQDGEKSPTSYVDKQVVFKFTNNKPKEQTGSEGSEESKK